MHGPLIQTDLGVKLLVRATAKARRNEIGGVRNGRLLVRVTAPPEDGKANRAIIKLLCKKLKLRTTACHLIEGFTNRNKTFLLENVHLEDVNLQR
jgi:uncharacterized protein (TIGR00251 family)